VFQRVEFGASSAGTVAVLPSSRPTETRFPAPLAGLTPGASGWRERIEDWAHGVNLVPDLGRDIGSAVWLRGAATCIGLCALAISMAPDMGPVPGRLPDPLPAAALDQYRAQMVNALALGADSGMRMAPTDVAAPLNETPERPTLSLDVAIGAGDDFRHALTRAGVSERDARAVRQLVASSVDPDSIAAGTRVRLVLGRRSDRSQPRPLESLDVRARLELSLAVRREAGSLRMTRIAIPVDNTPLRVRGVVGADGLYRAARAAGADPSTIQTYLKVLSTRLSINADLGSRDTFDIIVAHRRASTGETEMGALLFAGLERANGPDVALLRWTMDGREQWFDADGQGEKRGVLARPVAGNVSSGFGQRFHPILGYTRMHQGLDFAAAHGSPIYAASDGRVTMAGRNGGHGNYVRLDHGGGMGTGYSHMSRIATSAGQYVRRGQVIGYVGTTGLSTGPHLHYELYRNGVPVNPASIRFTQTAQLAGASLNAFRSRLSQLRALPSGTVVSTRMAAGPALSPAGGGTMPMAPARVR
jgi:murein DD-endopeptidase MepM/ murein hydrolase activator NlpD